MSHHSDGKVPAFRLFKIKASEAINPLTIDKGGYHKIIYEL